MPALAVWSGCLVGLWATAAAWWVAGAAVAAGGLLAATARRHRRRVAGLIAVLVCVASATALAATRMHAAERDPLVLAGDAATWVVAEVVLVGDPVGVPVRFAPAGASAHTDRPTADGRWRVAGRASLVAVRGSVAPSHASVTIFGDGAKWGAVVRGQMVSVSATASRDGFGALPGVVLRPRADPALTADVPWWSAWATSARAALARTAETMRPDPGGLLRGLVVGDTRGIDQALSSDAKIAGLTHLVAVSGTHMAVVTGAVMILLRRFGPRVSAITAAGALAAMVVLVGPEPSVLRSVVMGVIAVSAAVLGRPRAALPALSAAVFTLLLIDPTLAVSAGFALSVQATAALVLLAPAWIRALRRRGVPLGPATLIALPVAAHVATVPVIAAISGNVSLVAIPANMMVAPVVTPALLLGLGCLVLGPWWPAAARWAARADTPLLSWITSTAHRLAHWPSAVVPWPASPAGVLALTAIVFTALETMRHRRVRAFVVAAAMGGAAVLIPARAVAIGWPVDGWLLTACEVGQGDGMVLSTGVDGSAVVVDTGPDPEVMDACLRRLGITSIALLVLTHLHADHIDGLGGAVRGRAVGAIGLGPDRSSPSGLAAIRAAAAEHAAPVLDLAPGQSFAAGALTLSVLGPAREFHGTASDPNNDSVVMMATHDGVRMLMTGDVEREAQSALLRSGADLRADVLKQPHHGSSKLLPAFVAAVGARVAVIGVGVGNDYGHPSAGALATDRIAGVTAILRTDRDGDVQVCATADGLGTVARGAALTVRRTVAAAD